VRNYGALLMQAIMPLTPIILRRMQTYCSLRCQREISENSE